MKIKKLVTNLQGIVCFVTAVLNVGPFGVATFENAALIYCLKLVPKFLIVNEDFRQKIDTDMLVIKEMFVVFWFVYIVQIVCSRKYHFL